MVTSKSLDRLALKIRREADIKIEISPEELQIEGNASAIDPATDAEIANDIREQLDNGNSWAWCTVRVVAQWNELEGDDFLGACSYKDEADFRAGGYFDDMKEQALTALIAKAQRIANGMVS